MAPMLSLISPTTPDLCNSLELKLVVLDGKGRNSSHASGDEAEVREHVGYPLKKFQKAAVQSPLA